MRSKHQEILDALVGLGGRACATQIANALGRDPADTNIHKALSVMEGKGMVKRTRYAIHGKKVVKVWEVAE